LVTTNNISYNMKHDKCMAVSFVQVLCMASLQTLQTKIIAYDNHNRGARLAFLVTGGKMRMCRYTDVATGKMWRKMRINIHILPAHAPSVTGILKPLIFYEVTC